MATDTIAFPTPSIPLPAANAAQGAVAPVPDATTTGTPKYSIGDKVYLKGSWPSSGAAMVDSIITEFTLFEGVTHRYTISWPPQLRDSYWSSSYVFSDPNTQTVTEDQLSSEPTLAQWSVSGMTYASGTCFISTGISNAWHSPRPNRLPTRRLFPDAVSPRSIPKEPTSLDRYNPAEPSPL